MNMAALTALNSYLNYRFYAEPTTNWYNLIDPADHSEFIRKHFDLHGKFSKLDEIIE